MSTTLGGAPLDVTENPNMALSKWHFETFKVSNVQITGLKTNKVRVVLQGKTCARLGYVRHYIWFNGVQHNHIGSFAASGTGTYSQLETGANGDFYHYAIFEIESLPQGAFVRINNVMAWRYGSTGTSGTFVHRYSSAAGHSDKAVTAFRIDDIKPANGFKMEVFSA